MKVIVGLGNPGEKYAKNRHNAGFLALDVLARKPELSNHKFQLANKFESEILKSDDILLVKPQTFMNRSGESVSGIVNFYKVAVDDLIVVHDDLDIRLGEYKIQKGVGPKVHNGLTSVEERLGKADFWRVRVGIDNRSENSEFRMAGEDYVLADFTLEENAVLDKVIKIIVDQLSSQFGI